METDIISSQSAQARTTTSGELLKGSFTWMAYGLILSAIAAIIVAFNPTLAEIVMSSRLGFFALFAVEIGLVWYLSSRINTFTPTEAKALFATYAIVNGITLSVIFFVYAITSIISIFLSTAILFALLATFGATTKTDLTSYGRIAFIGLIAIVIASVINLFIGSTMADMIISWIGVAVFTVLTAYDTQKIANMKDAIQSDDDTQRIHVIGALTLYLDFINLFLNLLRLFGGRRR